MMKGSNQFMDFYSTRDDQLVTSKEKENRVI